MMDYSEVLTRAWQIIWKHKVLWIFGILAGCSRGSGYPGNGNFAREGDTSAQFQQWFESIPQETWILIGVGIAALVLVLVIVAIFLGTIGKIGLIRGVQRADKDLEARLSFGELFKGSLPYFWRVFLLNLLVGIVIFLAAMVLVVGLILGSIATLGLLLLCSIPFICLIIPIAAAISVIIDQATIAIVVENLGILDGLRRGWEVVRDNLGPMVVMWLILNLAIAMVGGLIIALPMIMVVGPIVIALFSGGEQALQTGLIVSGICFLGYLPFLVVLSGILNSYIRSGWTLTFLRLTTPSSSTPEPLPEPLPGPTPEPEILPEPEI